MNQLPLFDHDPPGMTWVKNLLDEKEQDKIVRILDKMPWDDRMGRRVQQYGFEYRYESGSVTSKLSPMPPIISDSSTMLVEEGYLKTHPNSAIVNEYLPGQGISNHIDSSSFGQEIAVVSLLSPVWVDFISPLGESRAYDVHPGDLMTLTGKARYSYSHGIAKRLTDDGRPRRRRISVTLRSVTAESPIVSDVL